VGRRPALSCFYLADPGTLNHANALAAVHPAPLYLAPKGEAVKTWEQVGAILEWLLEHHALKSSFLVVVGGGALSDAGGLAAALYKRGIPWVAFPTTLVAMVDAAWGGKCAVNFGGIKNSVGLFHPPSEGIYGVSYLNTLPSQALFDGWVEMLKHALIGDRSLYLQIMEHSILRSDLSVGIPAAGLIEQALAYKVGIVAEDPYEDRVRKLLNFGHTMGHALEAWNTRFTHGQAVWLGMWFEVHLAFSVGLLPLEEVVACQSALSLLAPAFPWSSSELSLPAWEALQPLLLHDKKNNHHGISWSLPVSVGSGRYQLVWETEVLERCYRTWSRHPLGLSGPASFSDGLL